MNENVFYPEIEYKFWNMPLILILWYAMCKINFDM